MKNNTNEIESIVLKYCEGTASSQEIEQVESWMAESDANYQRVKQLYIISLATDTECISKSIDIENALAHTHTRMKSRERIKPTTLKRAWNLFQRWAAILFIPITISLLVLLSQRENVDEKSLITISTNPGMTSTFYLPDSTLVCLNAQSKLVYPARFIGKTRNVTLEGEAYFEVSRNPEQRFVLSTLDNTKVEVLGTKFNVEAYSDMEDIQTTLLEGSIQFSFKNQGNRNFINLCPGEKIVYNKNTKTSKIFRTLGVSELSWKDGKIIFEKTSFKEALIMLERRFNVTFKIKNNKYMDYNFTGTFVAQQLEQIMAYFEISSNIQWRYLKKSPQNVEKSIIELY